MYFNRAYGQVGHVFQGRYQTRKIVTEADLVWVSRYVHRNPVAIGDMREYEWSSYRAYLGEGNRFCDPEPVLGIFSELHSVEDSYATFCEDVERTVLTG